MAAPTVKAIPAKTWTKVVTNVTAATLWKLNNIPVYSHTYRLTGAAAPTTNTDAVLWAEQKLVFSASAAADLYIYTSKAGSVRVDL